MTFLQHHQWSVLGPTLVQYDLILTWLYLKRPYFQMVSYLQVLQDRTHIFLLGRHSLIHNSITSQSTVSIKQQRTNVTVIPS
jgi:hypothetical protein